MLHAERLTPAIGAEISGLTTGSLAGDQMAVRPHTLVMQHQVAFVCVAVATDRRTPAQP